MDIIFLGTASGYPSPHRGASGLVLRDLQFGDHWLFDCGEGTQIQAQKSPHVHLGRITHIFISHLHGDHVYGLPGLLCTIDQNTATGDGNSQSIPADIALKPDVNIYGPQGLRRYLRLALALSRSQLRYTYAVHEIIQRDEHKPPDWTDWASLEADPAKDPPLFCERPGRDIHASKDGFWYNITVADSNETVVHCVAVRHTIPSLGWLVLKPKRSPSLRVKEALALGVPNGPLMGKLKRGESVEIDGRLIVPQDVLDPPVRGEQIAIMGDSCDSSSLGHLMDSLRIQGEISENVLDVLVHEATLGKDMAEDARKKGHSIPTDVVHLAARLNVRLLILTHFSQRYVAIEHMEKSKLDSNSVIKHTKPEKSTGLKAKEKPSLQELLDEAQSVQFDGKVILADDLALVRIPPISHKSYSHGTSGTESR